MKSIDQTIAELKDRDLEFREAYEALEPEYERRRALIDARVAKGWTQRELAEQLGTTQSVISRLEKGTYIPSVATLHRLAQKLDLRFSITAANPLDIARTSGQSAKRLARRPRGNSRPARPSAARRP